MLQNISEKWCNIIRRFRSVTVGMLCKLLYSIGIESGSFPEFTALDVDQAKVCADPHATRLIFLP